MAFDTPARIAVIGAGPIGLEAALYARFLGYQVDLYEQGEEVCHHVRQWKHVRLFTPFKMNRSTLGLAALAAQDDSFVPPEDDAILTGGQWVDQYLHPLSQTDLLVDSLSFKTRVVSISRPDCLKGEQIGDPSRAENGFLILIETADGQEYRTADIVIDTSGVFSQPNYVGPGGAPAIGEVECRNHASPAASLHSGLPDFTTNDASFKDRSTLIVGTGYSAATNVCSLAEIAEQTDNTSVTWFCRRKVENNAPIPGLESDQLSERETLTCRANKLASEAVGLPWLELSDETVIHAIEYDAKREKFSVRFTAGENEETVAEFDNVITNVGYRPDIEMFRELQVHQCYASEGPMKLASQLMGDNSKDCLTQTTHGAQALVTSEPNFYVLGSKSYGRSSNFLISTGLGQIKELFSLIGDRENLDLYATSENLSKTK